MAETESALAEGTVTSAQVTALNECIKTLSLARQEGLNSITETCVSHELNMVWSVGGKRLPSPQRGLNIIRQNNGRYRKEMWK